MHIRTLCLLAVLVLSGSGCLENLSEYSLPGASSDTQVPQDASDMGDSEDTANNQIVDLGPADVGPDFDMFCAPEDDAAFCSTNRANCGELTAPDNCGTERTANCGNCIEPSVCGGGGLDNVCGCASETDEEFCAARASECGMTSGLDACNAEKTVDCGMCSGTDSCIANTCACVPMAEAEICAAQAANCGEITADDGCGNMRMINCGSCQAPEVCGDTVPNVCGCTPELGPDFCARLVKSCDDVTAPDNCGTEQTFNCGTCTGQATCGGGGTPNVCGCDTQTDADFCLANGATCGAFTGVDACGETRTVACGTCTEAFETCGGGGTNNTCGCTPEDNPTFCSRLGAECGSLSDTDNCGAPRTANCDTCTDPEVCGTSVENQCACPSESDQEFCARIGVQCGSASQMDNCGVMRTADCGACGPGKVCTINQCECAPESNQQFCTRQNACGSLSAPDNCEVGRTVDCGSCATGTCNNNACSVCAPETDEEFCLRYGANCGALNAVDNCGDTRSVASCGPCDAAGESCAENTCNCTGETQAELCTAAGWKCGGGVLTDRCDVQRNVACGGCPFLTSCKANHVCGL